jgi:hypothetical protein
VKLVIAGGFIRVLSFFMQTVFADVAGARTNAVEKGNLLSTGLKCGSQTFNPLLVRYYFTVVGAKL